MTHASLFSGIGAAELAAAWMDWANLFHCEINPFGRKVLEYYFPDSIAYDDITKTDFTPWRGKIDILTGGFPCQPFSLAGRRKGAEDDRYLWPQMLRAIREIQPTWVVGENVAGLVTMVQPGETVDMGRTDSLFDENHLYRTTQRFTLDEIIQSLEDIGYAVQTFVIPAVAVGAPHRRDRLWIVAHRLAADTIDAGVRAPQHGSQREGQAQPRKGKDRPLGRAGRLGDKQPSALADKQQCARRRKEDGRRQQNNKADEWRSFRCDIERPCSEQIASNASERPSGLGSSRFEQSRTYREGTSQSGRSDNEEHSGFRKPDWTGFPSVSPVCRGNDGLPFDVARLTISEPKWRAEAIKAMGNAWMPQVAYEIFRAIEAVEAGKN